MSNTTQVDGESASPPRGDETVFGSGSTDPQDAEDDSESRSQPLPLDQVFGILKNQRRRYVLKYLQNTEAPVSLSEVAEQIAAWENSKDIDQITSSERKRVYVGLYQCHLPKMDGMDVVSFNKPRGKVELGENAASVYKYIDYAEESPERPWHIYSVGITLLATFVLASAMGLSVVMAVPVVEIAVAFVILVFLGYSVLSLYWIRSEEGEETPTTDV